MTREQAIEKIKKLQALKEGAAKIESEGEAKNAAAIIDKLQKQFGITMEEVYAGSTTNGEPENNTQPGYDSEERESYITTIKNFFVDNYHQIVDNYNNIDDVDERIDKTFDAWDKFVEEKVDYNQDLMNVCIRYEIDVYGLVDEAKEEFIEYLRKSLEKKEERERIAVEGRKEQEVVESGSGNSNSNTKFHLFGIPISAGLALLFIGILIKHIMAASIEAKQENMQKKNQELIEQVENGDKSYEDLSEDEKTKYDAFKASERADRQMTKGVMDYLKKNISHSQAEADKFAAERMKHINNPQ